MAKYFSFSKFFLSKTSRRGISEHIDYSTEQAVNATFVKEQAVRKLEPLTYFWNSLTMRMKDNLQQIINILGNERMGDATWVDLEIITLSEVSQAEKDKYHTISLICGI